MLLFFFYACVVVLNREDRWFIRIEVWIRWLFLVAVVEDFCEREVSEIHDEFEGEVSENEKVMNSERNEGYEWEFENVKNESSSTVMWSMFCLYMLSDSISSFFILLEFVVSLLGTCENS